MYDANDYEIFSGTWLLIGDSQDPIWRWSSFNVLSTSGNRAPRGPLSSLQEGLLRTAGNTLPNPRLPHSAPSVISYLEQQLLVSKALGSAQEYVHWLMALVSFLLTQGAQSAACLFVFISNNVCNIFFRRFGETFKVNLRRSFGPKSHVSFQKFVGSCYFGNIFNTLLIFLIL